MLALDLLSISSILFLYTLNLLPIISSYVFDTFTPGYLLISIQWRLLNIYTAPQLTTYTVQELILHFASGSSASHLKSVTLRH